MKEPIRLSLLAEIPSSCPQPVEGSGDQPEDRPRDPDDQPAIDRSECPATADEADDRTVDETETAQLTMSLFDMAAVPVVGSMTRRLPSSFAWITISTWGSRGSARLAVPESPSASRAPCSPFETQEHHAQHGGLVG